MWYDSSIFVSKRYPSINNLDVVGFIRRDVLQERERLDDTVVRHGNGGMMPFLDGFDEVLDRNEGIHIAHDRMQVQFDTGRRVRIDPFCRRISRRHDAVYVENVIVEIIAVLDVAVHLDTGADLQVGLQSIQFFLCYRVAAAEFTVALGYIQKFLGRNAIGLIGQLEIDDNSLGLRFPEFDFDNVSLEQYIRPFFTDDVVNRRYFALDVFTQPNAAVLCRTAGRTGCFRTARTATLSFISYGHAGFDVRRIVAQGIIRLFLVIYIFMGNIIAFHILTIDIGYGIEIGVGLAEGHITAVMEEFHTVFYGNLTGQGKL